jgi:hypothetical protein
VAKETKVMLELENLDVVADRGYFNSEEILADRIFTQPGPIADSLTYCLNTRAVWPDRQPVGVL